MNDLISLFFLLSGNPGLAYCTVCCKSLTAKKYILGMHQQKAKHIKRAGLTPDEVQDLMKKSLKDKSEVDPSSGKKFYERKYRPAWEREFPFISKVSSSFQQQMALPSRPFQF